MSKPRRHTSAQWQVHHMPSGVSHLFPTREEMDAYMPRLLCITCRREMQDDGCDWEWTSCGAEYMVEISGVMEGVMAVPVEHSPGPWTLRKADGRSRLLSYDGVEVLFLETPNLEYLPVTQGESEANLRLVTAAPELKRLLAEAVRIYRRGGSLLNAPNQPGHWITEAHQTLNEIAGEPPHVDIVINDNQSIWVHAGDRVVSSEDEVWSTTAYYINFLADTLDDREVLSLLFPNEDYLNGGSKHISEIEQALREKYTLDVTDYKTQDDTVDVVTFDAPLTPANRIWRYTKK